MSTSSSTELTGGKNVPPAADDMRALRRDLRHPARCEEHEWDGGDCGGWHRSSWLHLSDWSLQPARAPLPVVAHLDGLRWVDGAHEPKVGRCDDRRLTRGSSELSDAQVVSSRSSAVAKSCHVHQVVCG